MEYNDRNNTLDFNAFEKMVKEYNSKVYKFNNVSVYKFDINSVFKSQLESVLNIIYSIDLKRIRCKFSNKNLSTKLQLDKLNREVFDLYNKLYKTSYLMPIQTKIDCVCDSNNSQISDYFRLIKALINCDFYMLENPYKDNFKNMIYRYFVLVFRLFCA